MAVKQRHKASADRGGYLIATFYRLGPAMQKDVHPNVIASGNKGRGLFT